MEKVFCGSAKIIPTKFGELTKVSFSQKDLDTLQANMVNGWINLVVKEKKTKVEGKATHYLEVDTYKKDDAGQSFAKSADKTITVSKGLSDDSLPF
jgi:hypothetical protein